MASTFLLGPMRWIAEKSLDLLADRAMKKVLHEIDPDIKFIQEDIRDIRETQEQLLIAPLQNGMKHVRSGEFAKALDLLHEAESKNPYAPQPKLWLAIALTHLGRDRNQAVEFATEAMQLNPYYIQEELRESSSKLMPPHPPEKITNPEPSWEPWSLSLGNEEFNNKLASRYKWPKKLIQKYLSMYSSRSTAALVRASFCGRHLAVQWLLADNLRHRAEEVVAVFDLKSKDPIWAHLNKKEDIVYLSYHHVIIHLRERNLYSLLELTSGNSLKRMSEKCFHIMYRECDPESEMFVRSNWQGVTPSIAYERSAKFSEPRVTSMDTTLGHYPRLFREGAMLYDPLGMNNPPLMVLNDWNHFHFVGGANLMPSCRLVGGAKIISGKNPIDLGTIQE